jgi:hypothetical protein
MAPWPTKRRSHHREDVASGRDLSNGRRGCHRHSSSPSRFTAGAAGFFILSQSGERPER